MAPDKRDKLSATPATKSTAPTCTTGSTSSRTFADQSQSQLMTIPKELRNKIYQFVFSDNIDYSLEPAKYDWEFIFPFNGEGPEIEIHLRKATPPSKDTILPCRELHFEMKRMHAAAYRSYWTENHFIYTNYHGLTSPSIMPSDQDLLHVPEARLIQRRGHEFCYAEKGKYDTWMFPADADTQVLESWHPGIQNWNMDQIQNAVTEYLRSNETTWCDLNLRAGIPPAHVMLLEIVYLERVEESPRSHHGSVTPTPDAL